MITVKKMDGYFQVEVSFNGKISYSDISEMSHDRVPLTNLPQWEDRVEYTTDDLERKVGEGFRFCLYQMGDLVVGDGFKTIFDNPIVFVIPLQDLMKFYVRKDSDWDYFGF